MFGKCVICNHKPAGPICLSCLTELEEQVLEGARLIALLSRRTLELSKRLSMIELGKTVEQQRVKVWKN